MATDKEKRGYIEEYKKAYMDWQTYREAADMLLKDANEYPESSYQASALRLEARDLRIQENKFEGIKETLENVLNKKGWLAEADTVKNSTDVTQGIKDAADRIYQDTWQKIDDRTPADQRDAGRRYPDRGRRSTEGRKEGPEGNKPRTEPKPPKISAFEGPFEILEDIVKGLSRVCVTAFEDPATSNKLSYNIHTQTAVTKPRLF